MLMILLQGSCEHLCHAVEDGVVVVESESGSEGSASTSPSEYNNHFKQIVS